MKRALIIALMCTTLVAHGEDNKKEIKKPEEKQEQPVVYMTEQEIRAMFDKLNNTDKAALQSIQDQILSWPKQVFDEVRGYREFILKSRKAAEDRYAKLSEAAKEAMRIEESMKSSLTPDALKTLAEIKLRQ